MLLSTLKKCRRHSALMNRVDLVKVENRSSGRVEEPWPLPIGALLGDQFSNAWIRNVDCPCVIRQLTVSVASERQVGLRGKRCKSPPRTESCVDRIMRIAE